MSAYLASRSIGKSVIASNLAQYYSHKSLWDTDFTDIDDYRKNYKWFSTYKGYRIINKYSRRLKRNTYKISKDGEVTSLPCTHLKEVAKYIDLFG